MVSLRRRKLLGLYSGRNSFLTPLPRFSDFGFAPQYPSQSTSSLAVHPMPSDGANQQQEVTETKVEPGLLNVSGSSAIKEQQDHQFPDQAIKHRKRHRRKSFQNQEPCIMRGVYFKNMKWQAAIKVDKKQIHLGTVGSQEEAAHLYDRAAFMCGREPNFELSEGEKQELRKLKWEDFLAITRHAITNKKNKKRVDPVSSQKRLQLSKDEQKGEPGDDEEWDGEQGGSGSTSEEAEPDTSA